MKHRLFNLSSSLLLIFLLTNQQVFAENTQINPAPSETTAATHDAYTMQTPSPKEDLIITKAIQKLYKNSRTLSKLDINVSTHQGVVSLSGNVNSDSQASLLTELAQSVIGVKDVNTSQLNVKASSQPLTDTLITAKIKGLFLREKVFGDKDIAALNISVETKNGIVYLTGTVDNQTQLHNAIKIIEGVKGVTKVEYNMNKIMPTSKTTSSR